MVLYFQLPVYRALVLLLPISALLLYSIISIIVTPTLAVLVRCGCTETQLLIPGTFNAFFTAACMARCSSRANAIFLAFRFSSLYIGTDCAISMPIRKDCMYVVGLPGLTNSRTPPLLASRIPLRRHYPRLLHHSGVRAILQGKRGSSSFHPQSGKATGTFLPWRITLWESFG